jgi:hypothetical protein
MRRAIVVAALSIVAAAAAWAGDAPSPEQLAVEKVVMDSYVDGIHNFRRVEAVKAGFHPGFEMLYLREGKLEKLPIYNWTAALEERNRKEPLPPDAKPTTTARFASVDVTGTAAVCKVELTRDGKLVFTDYLSLYKFEDGWKIVGKVFHRHE